jgi:flagellar biosynthesis protein FlhB
MAEESFEEKTEAPSEKRRQEAREKGNVAKSNEVNSVLVLLAGIFLLKLLGPYIMNVFNNELVLRFKSISNTSMDNARLINLLYASTLFGLKVMLPIGGGIMVIGVLANFIQIGVLFTTQPLIPKLEKINPISGAKRLFSVRSLIETIKNIAKIAIVVIIAYLTIKGKFEETMVLSNASIPVIWAFTLQVAFTIMWRIALILIFIAILDYAYQRYEHEKQLKMTHQEVKEERKQLEGDPQVKSRIRSLQREMARRRMMDEVPKATVVVTNPTYIAIALRYEPSETKEPVVVAKGKRAIARRIKEVAQKESIPVVEDKPLARAMYEKVEIGMPIPIEFFTAVAEILAYVYRLKNRSAA